MKISIAQALATVLNIQVVPRKLGGGIVENVYVRRADTLEMFIGPTNLVTLEQAVWKAMEISDLKLDCSVAIFPISSNREEIYMSIERELLRQEAVLECPMHEKFQADPRDLITLVMEQLRQCATSLISPQMFYTALLRTGCVLIAGLQWTNNWLAHLTRKAEALRADHPEPIKMVEMPPPEPAPIEPVPPLFGADGLASLQVVEDEDKLGEELAKTSVPETLVGEPDQVACGSCDMPVPLPWPPGKLCPHCGEPVDPVLIEEDREPSEEALRAEREALGHDKPETL